MLKVNGCVSGCLMSLFFVRSVVSFVSFVAPQVRYGEQHGLVRTKAGAQNVDRCVGLACAFYWGGFL